MKKRRLQLTAQSETSARLCYWQTCAVKTLGRKKRGQKKREDREEVKVSLRVLSSSVVGPLAVLAFNFLFLWEMKMRSKHCFLVKFERADRRGWMDEGEE